MKIRNKFVSNSSSSSFIVIDSCADETEVERLRNLYGNKEILTIGPTFGCNKFGWEYGEYFDFEDKLMFALLQAKYVRETYPKWMIMLHGVLKNALNVKEIQWTCADEGYIDHQSASYEGENTEMFISEDKLRSFLFSKQSHIETGNDNE
jgi:hypothetical protein